MLISKAACRSITEHVEAVYPEEACGVLLGKSSDSFITEACRTENIAGEDDTGSYFIIDPLEIYRIEKEAERAGKELIGFYHSHPDKPAVLSESDTEHMIPGMAYIILSVTESGCEDMRGYIKPDNDGPSKNINLNVEETTK